jgi:hypothetical protein
MGTLPPCPSSFEVNGLLGKTFEEWFAFPVGFDRESFFCL